MISSSSSPLRHSRSDTMLSSIRCIPDGELEPTTTAAAAVSSSTSTSLSFANPNASANNLTQKSKRRASDDVNYIGSGSSRENNFTRVLSNGALNANGSNIHNSHINNNNSSNNNIINNALIGTLTPNRATGTRIYRTKNDTQWTTREIAALDFLLNIPLDAEREIVKIGLDKTNEMEGHGDDDLVPRKENDDKHRSLGYPPGDADIDMDQNESSSNHEPSLRWWEKLIMKDKGFFSAENRRAQRRARLELEAKELDNPTDEFLTAAKDRSDHNDKTNISTPTNHSNIPFVSQLSMSVPGRRLEGIDSVMVVPPMNLPKISYSAYSHQKEVARNAAVRDWEKATAYGIGKHNNDSSGLLHGRMFFADDGSYPIAVFSVIKYEKAREDAYKRRKAIEQQGRGGSQYIAPKRDWRGISYAQLLRRDRNYRKYDPFVRNIKNNENEDEDVSSIDSNEDDEYIPGYLDHPDMVQGKHRHIITGDKIIGPIISSTIQFVQPADLKADLNKQFRERFDGYEPAKTRRRFIGAQIVDGVYTLIDSSEESRESQDDDDEDPRRKLSVTSSSEIIRMPPSLTLSKIRNIKQQALVACVNANVEVSTVALACVYFERLCLDCRVDKSNRRISFAACLLLAYKLNEPHVAIVNTQVHNEEEESKLSTMSFAKRTTKSSNIFALLLDFFTQEWELSLERLFASEWGVFVALDFHLHATPSAVAFHFKRLMKKLERSPLAYLGPVCHGRWQDTLNEEMSRKQEHENRKQERSERRDRKLRELQHKAKLEETDEDGVERVNSESGGEQPSNQRSIMVTFENERKNGNTMSLWGKLRKSASMGKNMDKLSESKPISLLNSPNGNNKTDAQKPEVDTLCIADYEPVKNTAVTYDF